MHDTASMVSQWQYLQVLQKHSTAQNTAPKAAILAEHSQVGGAPGTCMYLQMSRLRYTWEYT